MPSVCILCSSDTNSKNPGISCNGPCRKLFHFNCANLPKELVNIIKQSNGILWKCEDCRQYTSGFNLNDLNQMIEAKFQLFSKTILEEMTQKFADFTSGLTMEIMKNTSKTLSDKFQEFNVASSSSAHSLSYSEIAKNCSNSKVLVRPKNDKQNFKETKSDIMRSADPIKNHIEVKKVKVVKNGGVVVELPDNTESKKFVEKIQEELQDNYTVTELTSILPKVRISGLTQNIDKDMISIYLSKQNDGLFCENSIFNVTSVEPYKKNPNAFNINAQCDALLYKKLLDKCHVLIGLDGCSVHDAFTLKRCYTCNGFNHFSNNCPNKNNKTCPVCAENHEVKDCNAAKNTFKCSNCVNNNAKLHSNFDTNHAAWDYSRCDTYKIHLAKMKKDLFGINEDK